MESIASTSNAAQGMERTHPVYEQRQAEMQAQQKQQVQPAAEPLKTQMQPTQEPKPPLKNTAGQVVNQIA
jgi:hypothetical protein